jgi:hypothetical protein
MPFVYTRLKLGSPQPKSTAQGWPMDLYTHSFIIRIWRETVDQNTVIWRGHITHIPDGTPHYLRNLDQDVADIVKPYLVQMGVSPPSSLRQRGWAALMRLLNFHPKA